MENKYIEDLREIKDMMSRTSRFSALSGLSGILVGVIGLLSAFLAYWLVFKDLNSLVFTQTSLDVSDLTLLLLIALGALVASLGLIFFLTTMEMKKLQDKPWDKNSKRVLLNLAIPLLSGGVIVLIFLLNGYPAQAIALTLVFYGLALVNASNYTLNFIRELGILELLAGLLALVFVGYSLILWAIGFGLLHIIYGFAIKARQKA